MVGCATNKDDGKVISIVYDFKLFEEDIPSGLDKEQRSEFIEKWIEARVYIQEFQKENLDDKSILQRVKQYENSLKVYAIEEKMVKSRLDTLVKENEIIQFYNEHKSDFELKDFLVKVMYLKLPSNAPDINKIEQLYLLKNPKDTAAIQDYQKLYAVNFYFDDQTWVYFDDILKEVPLRDYNKQQFIVRKSKSYFEDNGFTYFLNIYDYRLKDALSPLEFERDNIKQRIINNRIKKLRLVIKRELLEKAYDENKILIAS